MDGGRDGGRDGREYIGGEWGREGKLGREKLKPEGRKVSPIYCRVRIKV